MQGGRVAFEKLKNIINNKWSQDKWDNKRKQTLVQVLVGQHYRRVVFNNMALKFSYSADFVIYLSLKLDQLWVVRNPPYRSGR